MPDDAERALLAAGRAGLVDRLHATTDAFVAEHRVAIETLRDDAQGDLRQGGPLRALCVLLLFPLALPLGVYIVRNVAGMGVEWLGAVCSILCVLLSGAVVVMLRGRPLDRTSIGQQATATASVVAGAVFAWRTFGAQPIAIVCVVSAAAMLALLAALVVARVRHREVGRLRDTEAMDRADVLRGDLRSRLDAIAGSQGSDRLVEALIVELRSRAVPSPKRRLFADDRPLDQRGPQS